MCIKEFINEIIDEVRRSKIVSISSISNEEEDMLPCRASKLSPVGIVALEKRKNESLLRYELVLVGSHLLLFGEKGRVKVVPI